MRPRGMRALWLLTPAILVLVHGCAPAGDKDHPTPEFVFGDHGLGPGQFVYPRAIARANDGRIYIVDKTARVQRFSPDGKYETSWRMPEWQAGKPVGLSVDAAGRVLVADTHYARIIIYDRDGQELERYSNHGGEPGQFGLPTRAVVGLNGDIYLAEYGDTDRITRYAPGWKFVSTFGREGLPEGPMIRPQSVRLDTDGSLWVADACRHRILHFSADGTLLGAFGVAGRQPGELQYPYDLALCPDGTLMVAEFGNNRLQRFDRQGRSLGVIGGTGRAPGQFLGPWGVVASPDGLVYALDSGNNRVQVFRMPK